MRGLSYRKGQQQHSKGYIGLEDRHITLIIGVLGAEELLTVDPRVLY